MPDAGNAADELQCSDSDFGNANRKLRTRIDAEIEIRLVSVDRIIDFTQYRLFDEQYYR